MASKVISDEDREVEDKLRLRTERLTGTARDFMAHAVRLRKTALVLLAEDGVSLTFKRADDASREWAKLALKADALSEAKKIAELTAALEKKDRQGSKFGNLHVANG